MIPNITRGSSPARLLAYLFGSGRRNEHTQQHLLACARREEMMEALFDEQRRPSESFRRIGAAFDRTWRVRERMGEACPPDMRGKGNPAKTPGKGRIWHCSLSIKAGHGILADAQWEALARDYLARMGVIDEHGRDAAPWLAVRHGLSRNGNDHIHIMVSLAGYEAWINPWHDRIAAQQACRLMERERPELRELNTEPLRSTSAWQYRQWRQWAEWKARQDYGDGYDALDANARTRLMNQVAYDTMPRQHIARLVEACAADSRSEDEFIRRVRRCGLAIDPRLRKGVSRNEFRSADQAVGYTVTWRGADGWSERVSGYALGRDMTLKRLRAGWTSSLRNDALAAQEWRASMEHRPPALRNGRERRTLTAVDMNHLVDEAFAVAASLRKTDGDPDAYQAALRDGLRVFDRLRRDYLPPHDADTSDRRADMATPGPNGMAVIRPGANGATR
jgi:hypothetical protein